MGSLSSPSPVTDVGSRLGSETGVAYAGQWRGNGGASIPGISLGISEGPSIPGERLNRKVRSEGPED